MTNYDELNQFTNEYEKAVEEFDKARAKIMQDLQHKLKNAFTAFFNSCPEVEYITWTQYTPYFNDGDECIFSVNDMVYKLKTDTVNEDYNDLYDAYTSSSISWYLKQPEKYAKEIERFNMFVEDLNISVERLNEINGSFKHFVTLLNRLDDEVFKQTFGDHVIITATIDGFDVEEYDHE